MTYEKVTVHTYKRGYKGQHIATFNDLFTSLADVRRKVKQQCAGWGTVEVTAYPEAGYPPKTFNLRTK